MTQPTVIGELAVVALKAKNLPNREVVGKQDPFCVFRLGEVAKKTKTSYRGGQHPVWDDQVNIPVAANKTKMRVQLFDDDSKREDLISEGEVDLTNVLAGGEQDDWFPLTYKGRAAGEIYLELTFYAAHPPPRRQPTRHVQHASSYAHQPQQGSVYQHSPQVASPYPPPPQSQPTGYQPATDTGYRPSSMSSYPPQNQQGGSIYQPQSQYPSRPQSQQYTGGQSYSKPSTDPSQQPSLFGIPGVGPTPYVPKPPVQQQEPLATSHMPPPISPPSPPSATPQFTPYSRPQSMIRPEAGNLGYDSPTPLLSSPYRPTSNGPVPQQSSYGAPGYPPVPSFPQQAPQQQPQQQQSYQAPAHTYPNNSPYPPVSSPYAPSQMGFPEPQRVSGVFAPQHGSPGQPFAAHQGSFAQPNHTPSSGYPPQSAYPPTSFPQPGYPPHQQSNYPPF
ncbi:hypothetical protein J3Q64DRAFT_1754563 [Phycomyces blakesleeanus]|uniref:C2 domain-containing protein n=1 Tax=Phycomyces blakesleeanus TaxID=4837 RepID=A0ABR3ATF4_PHYBL